MFAEETPVMVPGEERLVLLDRIPDRLKSDLPRRHEVFVDYSDPSRCIDNPCRLGFGSVLLLSGTISCFPGTKSRYPSTGVCIGSIAAIASQRQSG